MVELPLPVSSHYTPTMPSHIAHLLFAEDSCARGEATELARPEVGSFLTLGAQGPDIFYHNQRRKPSGLTYGPLMHRHGYGRTVSFMARWAWEKQLSFDSWAGAWVIGFATHAILDRQTHPFINYFSGWVDPRDPHTEKYRSMHPFLERLIDIELLRSSRNIHPNSLDFLGLVDCGESPPAEWVEMMASALSNAYAVARGDSSLADRLGSAYLDTRGYYRFTNVVDEEYMQEALAREERGEIGARWLSIVHPPEVPDDVDVLNVGHREWTHPCDDQERFTDSFTDRYEMALVQAGKMVRDVRSAWQDTGSPEEDRRRKIEGAVGNWNLSDGRRTERPCPKKYADPLPLKDAQTRIRRSIS